MEKINKKINICYLIFLLLIKLFFEQNIVVGKIILMVTILYMFYQIYYFRRNQIFVIFILYALTYYLYLIPYYFDDIYYAIQYNLITIDNTNSLIWLQSFFMNNFFLFLKIIPGQCINKNLKQKYESKKIFYICFCIMIYICFFKLRGKSILFSSYGTHEINNPLLEYYIIFFILSWRYTKNKKLELLILILSLIFTVKLLLFGLRLAALFQLVLIFILYFENKIKTVFLISLGVGLFIFLSFLSFFRVGIDLRNIYSLLGLVEKDGVRWLQTNQGDVWMSSSMYLELLKNGVFDLNTRLKSIIGFWMSIFTSSKNVYKEAYFRNFAQQFYLQKVGGGGVTAIYLYIWYGYTGIIGFAFFLAKMINKSYRKKYTLYGVFLMVIFVRWFSYNILIVFKMGIYLLIIDTILGNFFNKKNYFIKEDKK